MPRAKSSQVLFDEVLFTILGNIPIPEQLDDIPLREGNTERSTEKWSLAARYDEIMFNRKKIYLGKNTLFVAR